MRSPEEALFDAVKMVGYAIERGQYHIAASSAGHLTRLAHSLESVDDVFVGEVLSGVCQHIDYVLRTYLVDDDEADSIHTQIRGQMVELAAAYVKQQDVSNILQRMRYVATRFVLDAEQRYPPRPDE